MRLLTAINLIMPVLGERPVTSLDSKHPTLGLLLPKVDSKLAEAQQQGWWFNSFNVTLPLTADGEVLVPAGTLAFVPCWGAVPAIVRGDRLYNPATMTYVFTQAISGEIIQKVEFDLLPESAASYVWHSVLVDAYITDIGLEQNVQKWMQEQAQALARMEAEHLRQKKYSTYNNPRFQRIRRAMRS